MNKRKTILNRVWKELILFLIGGCVYYTIEILFRGYSFASMFALGGLCFCLIGEINEIYPWDMPLVSQMLISALVVTTLEFIFGIILNKVLYLHIWDYSNMPYNLCGQICLLFTIAWFFLSVIAIILDDFIRWKFFGEEKPKYHIFYSHCENLHKNK